MKRKFDINKDFLIKEYLQNKRSSYEIADELGCSRKLICKCLKENKIKRRGYTFFKGHVHTPEIIKKLSLKLKGRPPNRGSFNKGCKVWNEGLKGVMKPNQSSFKKGFNYSKKTEFKKGSIPWNKNLKGFNSREKHPNWLGGKSFEPYGLRFNEKLKEEIRKKWNHECQVCLNHQDVFFRIVKGKRKSNCKLDIHHIDYNKKNSNKTNLICLCRNCHLKTNFNRDYWYAYFKYIMEND